MCLVSDRNTFGRCQFQEGHAARRSAAQIWRNTLPRATRVQVGERKAPITVWRSAANYRRMDVSLSVHKAE
jgi:hypothetical protein